MASKITSLYAETLILLKLWALDDTHVTKYNFVPRGKPYDTALAQLVKDEALAKGEKRKRDAYSLTKQGHAKLAQGLLDQEFGFKTNIGPKVTDAILSWFRQHQGAAAPSAAKETSGSHTSNGHINNGHTNQIESYESFSEVALKTYDQLNADYNLDDLVPIYRIRREMGDRLSRQQFNEWLLKIQSNDLVKLMGGELPDITQDQMEDAITIPGGGTRFFVRRL